MEHTPAVSLRDRTDAEVLAARKGLADLGSSTAQRVASDRVARKAVARILARGRACFFGFFSTRSWLLVMVMMFGGIAIRNAVQGGRVGSGVLGVVYLGIGTALFLADRVFWHAVAKLLFARGEAA